MNKKHPQLHLTVVEALTLLIEHGLGDVDELKTDRQGEPNGSYARVAGYKNGELVCSVLRRQDSTTVYKWTRSNYTAVWRG